MDYEEFANQLAAPEKLDLELDSMNGGVETHLSKIAKQIYDFNDMAVALKIVPAEVRMIEEKCRYDPARKRYSHYTIAPNLCVVHTHNYFDVFQQKGVV